MQEMIPPAGGARSSVSRSFRGLLRFKKALLRGGGWVGGGGAGLHSITAWLNLNLVVMRFARLDRGRWPFNFQIRLRKPSPLLRVVKFFGIDRRRH